MTKMIKDVEHLEKSLDKLINICRALKDENLHLRIRNDELRKDCSMMNDKNRLVLSRINSIVSKLKEVKNDEK